MKTLRKPGTYPARVKRVTVTPDEVNVQLEILREDPNERLFVFEISTGDTECSACRKMIERGHDVMSGGDVELCNSCSDEVMNLYHHARSGEYVTWIGGRPARRGRRRAKIGHSLRRQVFERDAYRCRECGGYERLCVDHVHPHSKGGTDELDNLQTLCWRCNADKSDTVPE